MDSLPVSVDEEGAAKVFQTILSLAGSNGLTSYDASYLELAMRLGLPLATDDGDLASAALQAGVKLL